MQITYSSTTYCNPLQARTSTFLVLVQYAYLFDLEGTCPLEYPPPRSARIPMLVSLHTLPTRTHLLLLLLAGVKFPPLSSLDFAPDIHDYAAFHRSITDTFIPSPYFFVLSYTYLPSLTFDI